MYAALRYGDDWLYGVAFDYGSQDSATGSRLEVVKPAGDRMTAHPHSLAHNPTGGRFLVDGRWQDDRPEDVSRIQAIWVGNLVGPDLIEAIHQGRCEACMGCYNSSRAIAFAQAHPEIVPNYTVPELQAAQRHSSKPSNGNASTDTAKAKAQPTNGGLPERNAKDSAIAFGGSAQGNGSGSHVGT